MQELKKFFFLLHLLSSCTDVAICYFLGFWSEIGSIGSLGLGLPLSDDDCNIQTVK